MIFYTILCNIFYRIELVPYLDNSGPTLAVNVLHSAGYKLLLSMLRKDIDCTLPRMDAFALEDTGIIYCEYFIVQTLPNFKIFFIKFTFAF